MKIWAKRIALVLALALLVLSFINASWLAGSAPGRIKLIAGLTGIGVDDLVQRDAQRRLRRVMAVTASAVIAIIVLSGLLVAAVRARAEAERQQAEAEGLIEFMLTDLRGRLKGVGRLDVMNAVNARAMDYYSDQSLAALPDQSLERRARILHAMGEDDEAILFGICFRIF